MSEDASAAIYSCLTGDFQREKVRLNFFLNFFSLLAFYVRFLFIKTCFYFKIIAVICYFLRYFDVFRAELRA